ncbi:uroporphyrinogen III methyltransferase / synthase [Acetitomaculum ruminis DSM 5522]|uniref:uroporphyrinogen-III C-methyltransferase n=1 Tax=Acetitomaculum ruminis DSM 5522 TaxID=1120918 RepID=A0A1I0YY15_9FIRM|nr:uroporphyrinogen-III C-methyltransferase [Acetitomaculum ruminis]SFB18244.1 uroporphyrinogen III methyltransferase / synthase [Acetitomaculum ruminis DSM 5522]
MKQGKVWLVGAGPSDAELLTLKAKRVLEEADVVVYDALVGRAILSMIPSDVRCIDVGKRSGDHTMSQYKMNELLLEEAQKGNNVVRLKGGDPFLFGRGGEELELLSKNNIAFEVVPGITSAISVPAYNGIPVTHRDYVSSLHIITGHKKAGEEYNIDFKALVNTKGTLVFLMGIKALSDIAKGLMDAGMDPNMPAAVLSKGTTSRQKRIVATLESLENKVNEIGIDPPGIIVVGKVCNLSNDFEWYEKLPLFGKSIIVTRPRDRASKMTAMLRKNGAEVLEIPSIKTIPMEENKEFEEALKNVSQYNYIAFTSVIGVKVFFEKLKELRIDVRDVKAYFAAIGSGTAKEIEKHGVLNSIMPKEFDGLHLGREIGKHAKDTEKILIPRAKIGQSEIVEGIKEESNAHIDDIAVYDTKYETNGIVDVAGEIEAGNIDYVCFTSASTVKGFVEMVKLEDYSKVKALCIGKQTEEAAKSFNMTTFVSKKATIDSLVELCIEMSQ